MSMTVCKRESVCVSVCVCVREGLMCVYSIKVMHRNDVCVYHRCVCVSFMCVCIIDVCMYY